MYRLDKTYSKAQTFAEAEKENLFAASVSYTERLNQAWYLTATAFGINPIQPPKMEKHISGCRKHAK
jgi:hypothetical protein